MNPETPWTTSKRDGVQYYTSYTPWLWSKTHGRWYSNHLDHHGTILDVKWSVLTATAEQSVAAPPPPVVVAQPPRYALDKKAISSSQLDPDSTDLTVMKVDTTQTYPPQAGVATAYTEWTWDESHQKYYRYITVSHGRVAYRSKRSIADNLGQPIIEWEITKKAKGKGKDEDKDDDEMKHHQSTGSTVQRIATISLNPLVACKRLIYLSTFWRLRRHAPVVDLSFLLCTSHRFCHLLEVRVDLARV
jgi:hypothetical protein